MAKASADEPEDAPARLLRAPVFQREHWKATLFAPYSPKVCRFAYLYTDHRYRLWVRQETDPDVTTFNERPPKVLIPVGKGRAVQTAPRFVSRHRDGRLTIHTFSGKEDADREPEAAAESMQGSEWLDWCESRGFVHKTWTHEELWADRLRLDNVTELLRFCAHDGRAIDAKLQDGLISVLRAVRKMTFYELARQFPAHDREVVHAEIAQLIIDRRLFSDIERHPFSMLTELSAHRHPNEE